MATRPNDVESIFSGALQRPTPAERSAFLDGACGQDTELRARVEGLLEAHEDAGSFLAQPVVDSRTTVESGRITEGTGTTIGRYKLLERVGEGGFGVVYMAEQLQPVRRKVALKIIKLGMDTKQVIARFEAERQALALMDHPNIARVLDAGATETGRPYFVMELVKGIPITQYCDKSRLPTAERLRLFQQVCEAVQHAHQKGVIHRDIKPSNVLVTLQDSKPLPKIIDFGIAKATSQQLTDKTLYTGFREFIGTPEYMSPDQAEISGLDIDTRTDIYSLGVLLYELLTGSTPFDSGTLRKSGVDEIKRIIRDVQPPKPSTRVHTLIQEDDEVANLRQMEPAALVKQIRGDLDWIVMKAIEKDRTRRYATANEFAADVGRYLSQEPVLAGPPSVTYKFCKFVRRHRVAVLAGVGVFAAIIIGAAMATIGFVKATQATVAVKEQRDAAEEARRQAEQARLHERTQRRLAETNAEMARQEADKSAAVSAFLQAMLGSVDPSRAQGREVSVRYVLDEAARKIEEGALQAQPEVEAELRMTLGRTYEALGAYAAAGEQLRAAEAIRARVLGEHDQQTLESSSALAGLLISQSRYAQAEQLARRTAQQERKLLGDDHRATLSTLSLLGVALREQNKLVEAEAILRETLEAQRRTLGIKHLDTLRSEVNLAIVLLVQGQHQQAERLLRNTLDVQRSRLGDTHPDTMNAMNYLAVTLERQGKYEQAEALYRQTLDLNRRVLGADHPRTQIPMNNLLRVLRTQGKLEETRPLIVERLRRLQRAANRPDADALALNACAWELLTCELEDLRAPQTALPLAQRAVTLSNQSDADILETLAMAYRQNGDIDQAIATQQLAVNRALAGGPYNVQELEDRLNEYLMEKADFLGVAMASLEQLATRFGTSVTTDDSPGSEAAHRARYLMSNGEYAEAEQQLRVCLATRQKELVPGHWRTAETLSLLGEALAGQEKFTEAEPLLLEGCQGLQDRSDVPRDRKTQAFQRIVGLYNSWGKPGEAQKWRERLESTTTLPGAIPAESDGDRP